MTEEQGKPGESISYIAIRMPFRRRGTKRGEPLEVLRKIPVKRNTGPGRFGGKRPTLAELYPPESRVPEDCRIPPEESEEIMPGMWADCRNDDGELSRLGTWEESDRRSQELNDLCKD